MSLAPCKTPGPWGRGGGPGLTGRLQQVRVATGGRKLALEGSSASKDKAAPPVPSAVHRAPRAVPRGAGGCRVQETWKSHSGTSLLPAGLMGQPRQSRGQRPSQVGRHLGGVRTLPSGLSPAVTPRSKWIIYVNPWKTSWLLPPLVVTLTVPPLGGGPGMGVQGGLGLEAGALPRPSPAAPAQALPAPPEAGPWGPGQVGGRQLAQDPPRGLVPRCVCGHQVGCPAEEGSPALAASPSPQPRRMSPAPWKAAASRSRLQSGPSCCCQQSWARPLGGGRLGSEQCPPPG